MANIFKRSTVKQKIAELKVPDFDKKLAIIQQWHNAYLDGSLLNKTEGQCEQAFNDDIFKKVLGYTEYPSQPHTIIPQLSPDKGGQRADAGLGWFDGKKQRVFAVVEIKDVNKPLERSQQREGNLTPIQQAFKYKPLFKDCRFVIATNFYEIRLFQDNQLDYEQFTLKSLCDPANDYFELKKFILLLSAENFVSGRGKSRTEELLSEIRIEQEKISKDFYNEYSHLRLELMRDIWKNNKTKRDIHFVTDKAQKLLDRIVFVSFCEDSGLLPDNTLHKVFMLSDSSNNFSSVWDTLKGFFKAVDSGSEKLGIPEGYNGGLFHEDHELDSLTISDGALKALSSFGRYDFENELTVNILGHVFEQSISDLEEIKQKVDPDEASIKSKRKKDGIFYTPEYIVDYIVQNSLGKYLSENQERIFEKYELTKAKTEKGYRERENKALIEYQDFLHTVKVVDPACGSGAFLVKVFDYLLEENRRVGELVGGLFSQDQVYKDILRNNIYGVDLNEESVRITQLSLWLKTAQRGKKLTYLDKNIRVGNSLIDDPKIAGSKAFNWKEEFKEVFDNGGFDVVVGNPPYTYRNAISKDEKDYFLSKYSSIEGNFDLYKIFIEKISELASNYSTSSFIIPNTFLSAKTYQKLRKHLVENYCVKEIYYLGLKIFEGVVVESVILTVSKNPAFKNTLIRIQTDRNRGIDIAQNEYEIDLKKTFNEEGTFNIYLTGSRHEIVKKIKRDSILLGEISYVTVGINTGYIKDKLVSKNKLNDKYHKLLSGKDISRYSFNWKGDWVIYDKDLVKSYGDLGRSLPPENIFIDKKILVQRTRRGMKRKIVCYYDENQFYNLNRLSNIVITNNSYQLRYIYALLNSKALDYYFNTVFNEYEVKPLHLSMMPIKSINAKEQKTIGDLTIDIEKLIKKRSSIAHSFIEIVLSQHEKLQLKQKFNLFWTLNYKDFLKETGLKLNINENADLNGLFNKYQFDCISLSEEIENIDKSIEDSVCDLYSLSEIERQEIFDYYV